MNNVYYGKLVFELSKPGRVGYSLPKSDRRRLEQEGIEIEGEDKLRRVLEDYGS